MKRNPKIVSITRNAAYLHQRAMKNRRDNNQLDALELLRRAVENSPENQEYKLDLAEMYCEMGCHEQSNRILLDMLAQGDAPAECYYGLALNQMGRNEPESARRALRLYEKHAPEGEYNDEAANLAAEIAYYQETDRPISRKVGRALKIADHACEAMREDDPETAVARFEKSFAMHSDQPEMRAVYAMALRQCGRFAEAVQTARDCCADADASVRTLCMAAQVLWLCSEKEDARTFARRAIDSHPNAVELRLLIFALGELQMHEEAAEAVRRALQESPHDRQLLHMRAVGLHLSGAPDADVASYWLRILRIDPEDSIARYYCALATEGKLKNCKMDYTYDVPVSECRRRLTLIAEVLSKGLDFAVKTWKREPAFRKIIQWSLNSGIEERCHAPVVILASADDPEAESLLRWVFYRGDIPLAVKMHGKMFLHLRGANPDKFLPPDVDPRVGLMPEANVLTKDMPVYERQMVRFAGEVLADEFGIFAESALAVMWRSYRAKAVPMGKDPLVCTQEVAAALAWNYLLRCGEKPSASMLAEKFECNSRRMVYYARRMAAVLEGNGAEDGGNDENH